MKLRRMDWRLVGLVVSAAATAAGSAAPLNVVEVSAPAINCIFDSDCTITVTDSTAPITLPAADGQGFLQSRTAPPGEPGTVGEGIIPYEYRIDLRQVGGLTALPCITELSLDFGPHQPLDFNGDGVAEDVFVVTGGGLGSVGPVSADKVGDRITFRFRPAVCAGNRPGAGESTFFFGLGGLRPPQTVTAQAVVSLGGTLDLEARAPGSGGAVPIPPPPPPPPAPDLGLCLPGLPITADVPVCRCLRDAGLRELRCGVLHSDFVLVRRTPLPIPPGPFTVRWAFAPLGNRSGSVVVEDGLPPGFARPRGSPSSLKFQAGNAQTLQYRLTASRHEGTLSTQSVITFEPNGARGNPESSLVLLPLGPRPWPGLEDAPSEPRPTPPDEPDFGVEACGRAAHRLWNEYVERFSGTPFGLSPAVYSDLQERAKRCRRAIPSYGGPCGPIGQSTWAGCFVSRGSNCSSEAEQAIEICRRLGLGGALDDILAGHRADLIDLGRR